MDVLVSVAEMLIGGSHRPPEGCSVWSSCQGSRPHSPGNDILLCEMGSQWARVAAPFIAEGTEFQTLTDTANKLASGRVGSMDLLTRELFTVY